MPEARDRFPSPYGKILEDRQQGISQINDWRHQGLRVALTPAMLDLPTERHAEYFRAIANLGVDKVVVGIDTDRFVAQRKDPLGPIRPWRARAEHTSNYPYVDLVIPKDGPEADWIRGMRPSVIIVSSTSFPGMRQRIEEMLPYLQQIGTELVLMDERCSPIVDTSGRPDLNAFERQCLEFERTKSDPQHVTGSNIRREIIRRYLLGETQG